jgi:heat shock protein HtpX
MFDSLLARPSSYRRAPSTRAATALAFAVLVAAVGFVAFLVWATAHVSGPVAIGLVALGWASVLVMRPRRRRLSRDAVVLDPTTFPGIHALLASVGTAVGVTAPAIVAVNLDFNAYVTRIGRIRGSDAIVLGLPMMSLGSWHERIGVLGHELGHLRGRDTARGRLIGSAASVLARARYLVAPSRDWVTGQSPSVATTAIQGALGLPFLGLALALDRLAVSDGQHREYLADRRATEVVGSDAVVGFLLRDLEGISTATASAARRGEDPFDSLLARPCLTSAERGARLAALEREVHRADATHPPDHLRVKLARASALPPSTAMPGERACLRAEAELVDLRAAKSAEFSTLLRHDLA